MPAKPQEDLLMLAVSELTKAFAEAQSGKSPDQSYDKLKKVYDTLSAAEKKREKNEITDDEMQNTMAEQVEKLKGI